MEASRDGWATRLGLTVLGSTVAVTAVAAVQHRFVLGVELHARVLVVPVAVGVVFGVMLALVRESRARERITHLALVTREAEISRFNVDLEERVRQRTSEVELKTAALLRAQKMEVLGLLAGGVAHDFNNILTAVMGCSDALRSEASRAGPEAGATLGSLLDELDESADRARRLTQQLLTLGRSGTAQSTPVDLGELLVQLRSLLGRLLGETIEVRVSPPTGPALVQADRSQLEQLVLNLAVNARDAMPSGGTLSLSVERTGPQVYLVVSDTGTGMDEATRAKLFEPFFTTKARGRGTGLGMAVVQEVVRSTRGRIDVESQPGRGTRICVTFPATDEPGRPLLPGQEVVSPTRSLRVLLVEDDAAVRRRLVAALAAAGHLVLEAAGPADARSLVQEHGATIDAVVCDVVLPRATGPDLVERLRPLGLGAPVIFISGYSPEELLRTTGPGLVSVLQKPFAPEVLLARLDEVAGPLRRI